MRDKYVEESFSRWMIFGESKDGQTVDVVDRDGDVAVLIPRALAVRLIEERARMVDALIAAIGDDDGSDDRLDRAREAYRGRR